MTREDREIRKNLEDLTELLKLKGMSKEVGGVAECYAGFSEIKTQIIKLSRENTNVRSLAIALNEKRKVMLAGQDTLAALTRAVEREPVYKVPVSPR